MAQITLDGQTILIRRCSYPGCNRVAIDTYHGNPLCAKHLELAEFIDWFLTKFWGGVIGQKVGTTD